MKQTLTSLLGKWKGGEKIAMVTAYDYTMARLASAAGADMILVGDSLGMVMMGYEDTLSVTMDDMVHHTACVSRGCGDAFLVADMPFMSYQTDQKSALENAGRLIKEGRAKAVKLEGGAVYAPLVEAMVRCGIPVVGHLGLTPQSVNAFGGFRVQAKSLETAQKLLDDARTLERAGAFAIVLECVPALLAQKVSSVLTRAFTIGIGAGPGCGGQVLVGQDLLGMYSDFTPKFVKHFAEVGECVKKGFAAYCSEVKAGTFPAQEHCFSMPQEIVDKLV